jgi:hypothetical protein
MLLGNYSIHNANPGKEIGGYLNPFARMKAGTIYGFYSGDHVVANETNKSSWNNGYRPPYSWMLAPKAGGMASNTQVQTTSDINAANLAAGKNLESAITASGNINSAVIDLVVSMVTNITASGLITDALLVGTLNMTANVAASGNLTATVEALAHLVASLNAAASMSPQMNATANMEADITPFTELSPENLAAAVWNAVANQYNTAGTMGEAMNDAGTGGAHPNLLDTETGNLIIPLD